MLFFWFLAGAVVGYLICRQWGERVEDAFLRAKDWTLITISNAFPKRAPGVRGFMSLPISRIPAWLLLSLAGVLLFFAWGQYQHFDGVREGVARERRNWEQAVAAQAETIRQLNVDLQRKTRQHAEDLEAARARSNTIVRRAQKEIANAPSLDAAFDRHAAAVRELRELAQAANQDAVASYLESVSN